MGLDEHERAVAVIRKLDFNSFYALFKVSVHLGRRISRGSKEDGSRSSTSSGNNERWK